mgnify:CR=1 FL=1
MFRATGRAHLLPVRSKGKAMGEATEHDTSFRRRVKGGLDAANAGALLPAEYVEAEAAG